MTYLTKTEQTIWTAWNALPDDDPEPVKRIARDLGMEPADVAFVVFPAEQSADGKTARVTFMTGGAARERGRAGRSLGLHVLQNWSQKLPIHRNAFAAATLAPTRQK